MFAEGEYLGNIVSQKSLERVAKEGDSPVGENNFTLLIVFLEYLKAKTLRESS